MSWAEREKRTLFNRSSNDDGWSYRRSAALLLGAGTLFWLVVVLIVSRGHLF